MVIATVIEDRLSQLILLPVKASFPQGMTRLNMKMRGNERIISPNQKTWDDFF